MNSVETQDVWLPLLFIVKLTPSKKNWHVSKPSWVKPGLLAKIVHSDGGFFDEHCLIVSFTNMFPNIDSSRLKEDVVKESYYVQVLHKGILKTFRGCDLYLCNVPVQKIPVCGTMGSTTRKR